MSERLPYEDHLQQHWADLPLPDENKAWEDMRRRLECLIRVRVEDVGANELEKSMECLNEGGIAVVPTLDDADLRALLKGLLHAGVRCACARRDMREAVGEEEEELADIGESLLS